MLAKRHEEFTFHPGDEATDPEYVLDSNPRWRVQVCASSGGGFSVTEAAPEGTPDEEFWVESHGYFTMLWRAQIKCIRLARLDPLMDLATLDAEADPGEASPTALMVATLYEAALERENVWQAALEKEFGADAGQARYEPRGRGLTDGPLREAYRRYRVMAFCWRAASDAYRDSLPRS